MKMFLAFGLAFEIPVATFLLAWTGISTADSMAKKRPYVIIGCFVVGMLMTPPDVVSQLLLAIPTWLLFEFGVIMARFVEKRDSKEEPEKSNL
jgi:sec-independent protein translocase protein TatC